MDKEKIKALILLWRDKAAASQKEAGRIRHTIKQPTDAEAYCNVRTEVWLQCAADLEEAARVAE